MDPSNPKDAQAIVAAYLQAAEAHAAADVYPNSLRDLPYSKELIREAFRTSTTVLVETDQMTPELRDYLEVAYVSLADYVDDESAALLREYARAGQQLAADRRLAREKVHSEAWRRLSEQSRLVGELAREITAEAERLRAEFRSWQHVAPET